MLTPCEVAVKCALPSIRAMVASELTNNYNLKQAEAAKLLGISQPAVSLYQQKLRGNSIDPRSDPQISTLVAQYAEALANGKSTYGNTLLSFCKICRIIRSKGFMCKIHKAFDPATDLDKCDFCQTVNCP